MNGRQDERPVPNVDLLTRTLRYIEDNPKEWDQRHWICGTTACFAGRACLLAQDDGLIEVDNVDGGHEIVFKNEKTWYNVERGAQRLLGLTAHEAETLFTYRADLHWLQHYVAEIVARASR